MHVDNGEGIKRLGETREGVIVFAVEARDLGLDNLAGWKLKSGKSQYKEKSCD